MLSLRCSYLLILVLLSIKSFNHRYRLFSKIESIPAAFAIPASRPWRCRRLEIAPVWWWGQVTEQVCKGPKARRFRPSEQNGNPGQSFLGQLAENRQNRHFSANHRCISPDPDFTSLPNFHPEIERLLANTVQAIRQRNSAGAHRVNEKKG